MMRKSIRLDIPVPCHESWEQMTQAEQGRFCNACQKKVIDFRNMTDTQLLNFFLDKDNRKTCGNFQPDQLSRVIMAPRKPVPWFKYILASMFPAILLTTRGKTQEGNRKEPTEVSPRKGQTSKLPVNMMSPRVIAGKVTDEDGNGIPNAKVTLSPGISGGMTDSSGRFSIELSETLFPYSQIRISSIGYTSQLIDMAAFLQEKPTVVLIREVALMGDVVVVGTAVINGLEGRLGGVIAGRQESRIDSLKQWIWPVKSTPTVFPNPARKQETLTIQSKLVVGEEYQCSVVDMQGRISINKLILGTSSRVYQISLPGAIASGPYLVILKSSKGKTIVSEKLLVQ
jgi:hypothetical protein